MEMRTFKKTDFQLLVGVDEAGRGPLAGPLALCALLVREKSTLRRFAGIKDSKQLSVKKREEWFAKIREAEKSGMVVAHVVFAENTDIDRKGMGRCLREATAAALAPFAAHGNEALVLLDGTLHAPMEFVYQRTITRGDEKERVIAMASVAAKVERDRAMLRIAAAYPQYGFEKHKGYGTATHYAALQKHGITPVHRRSFLRFKLPTRQLKS